MSATAAPGSQRRLYPWNAPTPGAVPPLRTLLRWLYIGRLSAAAGVFVGAVLAWWRADITQLLIASVSITAAFMFTAWSVWQSHVRRLHVSQTFLYAQAVFDIALVTAFVHISGPYTYFAALYILVIAVNAVTMPFPNGMLVALLAGFVYAADAVLLYPVEVDAALLLQVAVYWSVAAATGYLASRVRVAGQAQEVLTEQLQRVQLEAEDILDNLDSGILTVGADGRLVYANSKAESLLGIDAERGRDRPVLEELERLAPVLGEAVRATMSRRAGQVRREGEARVNGRTFPIGVSTKLVKAAWGDAPSVTANFKDISDQKRLEQLHLRTERLEAVAEIAASLAHEIKNPLASIRSAVEQLSRASRNDPDERTLAGLVMRESDRLSRLLAEFLDFTRVRVTKSALLDLVAVAEEGVRLARAHPDCPGDAVVELVASERPIMVEGDEDLLHRVVFNLVLNAVQAQPAEPRVSVEVGVPDPATLSSVPIEQPRLLRVRDYGPGVPADVLPRLFEPFVTGRIGGTGLGLAIVQRAVQAHRGVIFPDSSPGQGATFTILLPARFAAEEAE